MRILEHLKRLVGRRERRLIFRFRPPTGGAWQYRDPVEIREKLNAANANWSELVAAVAKSAKPSPDFLEGPAAAMRAEAAESATRELAELVSDVFGVKPLQSDGSGWTRGDRIDLMAEYLDWCGRLLEDTRPLASSPPATESAGGG